MNAGVVGQFRVERRGKNVALAQTDHIAVNRRFDRGLFANLSHERSANEHQREILEHNRLGSGTFRNALPRRNRNGDIASSGTKISGRNERAKLTAVRVAAHDGVKRAEIHVLVIV